MIKRDLHSTLPTGFWQVLHQREVQRRAVFIERNVWLAEAVFSTEHGAELVAGLLVGAGLEVSSPSPHVLLDLVSRMTHGQAVQLRDGIVDALGDLQRREDDTATAAAAAAAMERASALTAAKLREDAAPLPQLRGHMAEASSQWGRATKHRCLEEGGMAARGEHDGLPARTHARTTADEGPSNVGVPALPEEAHGWAAARPGKPTCARAPGCTRLAGCRGCSLCAQCCTEVCLQQIMSNVPVSCQRHASLPAVKQAAAGTVQQAIAQRQQGLGARPRHHSDRGCSCWQGCSSSMGLLCSVLILFRHVMHAAIIGRDSCHDVAWQVT